MFMTANRRTIIFNIKGTYTLGRYLRLSVKPLYLPPELRTFSLPPPSPLQIIKHHLQHAPLSPPRAFPSKLKSPLFKLSFSDSLDSSSSHSPPKLHPP